MSRQKYRINTMENRAWMKELGEELLRFGWRFPSPGGSSYYLGDDGTPWTDRPRETWITSRMTHVYSLGQMLNFDGSEELVDSGLRGLLGELRDKRNGGWYAGLTASGEILPTKQCYAHAFVILAATSAVFAERPGAEELLKEALAAYDKYFWDEEAGLAYDTWNTEFTELSDYRGINANMHTVEAFLAVWDATGDSAYRERAGRIIDHVIHWASKNHWRIPEHFRADWTPDLEYNQDKPDDPFKPYGATPGHGIEWARLIVQWTFATFGGVSTEGVAESTERAAKPQTEITISSKTTAAKPYLDAAEALYDRAVKDAWNVDGMSGLVYTTDWNGKPIVHDRMHWTLAEAINTSAVLFRVTGKERCASDYATFLEYLDSTVLDKENGSWFHQLDRENQVIGTVWDGKSDLYHALQATLIPYNLNVGVSIAAAIRSSHLSWRSGEGRW